MHDPNYPLEREQRASDEAANLALDEKRMQEMSIDFPYADPRIFVTRTPKTVEEVWGKFKAIEKRRAQRKAAKASQRKNRRK